MFLQTPERHFSEQLDCTARCYVCEQPFLIKEGSACEGWLFKKEGTIEWGATVTCTLRCMTAMIVHEGTA
jgi:hypothetical protein